MGELDVFLLNQTILPIYKENHHLKKQLIYFLSFDLFLHNFLFFLFLFSKLHYSWQFPFNFDIISSVGGMKLEAAPSMLI